MLVDQRWYRCGWNSNDRVGSLVPTWKLIFEGAVPVRRPWLLREGGGNALEHGDATCVPVRRLKHPG